MRVEPGIPATTTIHPTAIILHWWGFSSGGNIEGLVLALLSQTGYYEPYLTKAQYDANMAAHVDGHHLGVQIGITSDGKVYQLTPELDSYAAHAACANNWAIGIEIEGAGPADLHADHTQFEAVVRTVLTLMRMYGIPLDGPLAVNGLSGIGVHSHKQVDLNCKFADGTYAGQGKIDVDDAYLAEVKAAVGQLLTS